MKRSLRENIFTKVLALAVVVAAIAALAGLSRADEAKPAQGTLQFDADGNLVRPEGYRSWMFVGCNVTPNDMNQGSAAFPGFHVVYIKPDSYTEFEKTGKFPDGTILVKELVGVGGKQAPSGNGYFMGGYTGLLAAVKDSTHFSKEPGNWAYFNFSQPNSSELNKTAKAFPTASCNACHQDNAETDWVFTQYYPLLQPPKAK